MANPKIQKHDFSKDRKYYFLTLAEILHFFLIELTEERHIYNKEELLEELIADLQHFHRHFKIIKKSKKEIYGNSKK